MVFKQRYKYLTSENIYSSDSKTRTFVLSEYIYFFILFYIRRAILTQTNPKNGLIERKNLPSLHELTQLNGIESQVES